MLHHHSFLLVKSRDESHESDPRITKQEPPVPNYHELLDFESLINNYLLASTSHRDEEICGFHIYVDIAAAIRGCALGLCGTPESGRNTC